MTEGQRPRRAHQPWNDPEYALLDKLRAGGFGVDKLAKKLARYPNEIEPALERLRIYNEKLTKRNEEVEHRQAIKEVFESWETKQANEAVRNFPERLTARYGSGLREFPVAHLSRELYLDAVHKPKTTILDLSEIEKRIPEAWKNEYIRYHILRKARRLIINGKNYDSLLRKARERVHLQIEISATLAGGK